MPSSFPTSRDTLTNPTAADQKNSASVPHASQHANANDAIEAIEALLPITSQGSVPRGVLPGGYAQATADQTGITNTEVDLTSLAVTVTTAASRRIRITGQVQILGSVVGDTVQCYIKEGSTYLGKAVVEQIQVANQPVLATGSVILTPGTGAHTYKLVMNRTAGTGSITARGEVSAPSFILAEDIGAV